MLVCVISRNPTGEIIAVAENNVDAIVNALIHTHAISAATRTYGISLTFTTPLGELAEDWEAYLRGLHRFTLRRILSASFNFEVLGVFTADQEISRDY